MKDGKNKWEDEYIRLKDSKNLWKYTLSDINRNTKDSFAFLLIGPILLPVLTVIAYVFGIERGMLFTLMTILIRASILIPKYLTNYRNRKLTKEEYIKQKKKKRRIRGPIGYILLVVIFVVKIIQLYASSNQ